MIAGRRVMLALLVALLAMVIVVPVGTSAATLDLGGGPPVRVLPDPSGTEVERPPFAHMTRTEVLRIAAADREVRRTLVAWPDAGLRVLWLPSERRWRVSVRTVHGADTLLMVDVSDATGAIIDREHPALGQHPTHHSEREAIDAAVADPRTRHAARAWGGVEKLRARASRGVDTPGTWQIDLYDPRRADGDPERPVIRAFVDDLTLHVEGAYTGYAIDWQLARGDRTQFGGASSKPLVWIAFMAVFVLIAIDWHRWRTLATVDVLVLSIGLGISHEAFQRGAIEWSVPLAVPPLLWLCGRLAWQFIRGVPRSHRPVDDEVRRRRVPLMVLVVACVLLAGLRTGLAWDGGNVIDVGHAGVEGARLELAGKAVWGGMPKDILHGDTYGPVNYLAYVPATVLVDDPGAGADAGTRAAMVTTLVSDMGCALLLALVGWRWISRRAGVLLALGWLACPWTIWAVSSGTNDLLVAMLLVASFSAMRIAWLRGALLGVAAMVKFAPAIVLPAVLHVGTNQRGRQALFTTLAFVASCVLCIAWALWRIDSGMLHGLRVLWRTTVAFQATRDSPFSPWGMYHLGYSQWVAQGIVVGAALLACVRPRVRDAWQIAAGIGALLIASQLVVTHWTYLYVPWFVPFMLIVLAVRRELPGSPAPRYAPDHEQH